MSIFATSDDVIVNGKYLCGKKIGSGTYADVYIGTDLETRKEYAMKFEKKTLSTGHGDSWFNFTTLAHEYTVYQDLAGGPGIPEVYWFGTYEIYAVLVMDLRGESLENLLQEREDPRYMDDSDDSIETFLTNDTIASLAVQMIDPVEYIHSKGYIHCDIKPANMVLGGPDDDTLFMIDFGQAQKYVDNDKKHIKFRHGKIMKGTLMFASSNAHKGNELSRRDDMISLGYSLAYLINGKLPWTIDQRMTPLQLNHSLVEQKRRNAVDVFGDLPEEYISYLDNVNGLKFRAKPQYTKLALPFQQILCTLSGLELPFKYLEIQDTTSSPSPSSSSSPPPPSASSSSLPPPPRTKRRASSPSGSSSKKQHK